MKIYLTNLFDYNNGILRGRWVDPAGKDEEDIREELRFIGVGDFDEFGDDAGDGGEITSEEFFITDYEDAPIELDKHSSLDDCIRWADLCEEYGLELVSAIADGYSSDIEDVEGVLIRGDYTVHNLGKYPRDKDEALGESIIEEGYYSEYFDPNNPLSEYIDYSALGYDFRLDTNGFFCTLDGDTCYLEIL